MYLRCTLLLLLLIAVPNNAQFDCGFRVPPECSCVAYISFETRLTCLTDTVDEDPWNITATFDRIADSIFDDSKVLFEITVDGQLLTAEQDIPAGAIARVKGSRLIIEGDFRFSNIHPEAFTGLSNYAFDVSIYDHTFPNAADAFALFNNFPLLQYLFVSTSNLTDVPANAFGNLEYLEDIYIDELGIQSVGDNAFSALPNVGHIDLKLNQLTLDRIANNAFVLHPDASGVDLFLEANPLEYVPEEKFRAFLEVEDNRIFVGSDWYIDEKFFLPCDERMDWICLNEITGLSGYYCQGYSTDELYDIYDYCEDKFSSSPLYRGMDPVVRNETRHIRRIQYLEHLRGGHKLRRQT